MIYICKFKETTLAISKEGKIVSVDSIGPEAAILTETIASSKKGLSRYYTCENGLYFFEKSVPPEIKRPKSLLQALNLRGNAIVGLFFDGHLLIFAFVNGEIQSRFPVLNDSDDPIEQAATFREQWKFPEDIPLEIYGANLPFHKLIERIDATPVFGDTILDGKKHMAIMTVLSALIVLSVIAYGLLIKVKQKDMDEQLRQIQARKLQLTETIKKEETKRLPLYLQADNLELEDMLNAISFLNNQTYSDIRVSSDAATRTFTGTATTSSPSTAYELKNSLPHAQVQVKGGDSYVVAFSGNIKAAPDTSDARSYSGIFNIR